MWNLKYNSNEHIYETNKKKSHRHREQNFRCQGGAVEAGRKDLEFGISRYKLVKDG